VQQIGSTYGYGRTVLVQPRRTPHRPAFFDPQDDASRDAAQLHGGVLDEHADPDMPFLIWSMGMESMHITSSRNWLISLLR
jgi:hypothetical protein